MNKSLLLISFISFISFICFYNISLGQNDKYIIFNENKDKIVKSRETINYKIDENLFDVTKFNKVDTLNRKELLKINFIEVHQLWKEANKEVDSLNKAGIKKGRIKVIETYNQIFKKIFVIEKISDSLYKRSKVWWIDYEH